VRLLLDTRVVLWWLSDDRKLAKIASDIIANRDIDVLVSSASAWGISIKAALGRLEIELDDLESAMLRNGFRPLPIGIQHVLMAGRLPNVHRDPFVACSWPKPGSRNCDSFLTTEWSSFTASPQKDCRRSSFDFRN
jgi:PIN domain nuclease of toxin-antitoxin system